MRSVFVSRSQTRICSGSSHGRAANGTAAQLSQQQILPTTVPLCYVFFVFALVSHCLERQNHDFEVVSLLLTSVRSPTCPVSSKVGFYSGERDRVDQQDTIVLSVKDRA